MSRATSLINRVGHILTKVNAVSRTVYKRTVTRTGGDQLLGRPYSVDYKDILLNPPPIYLRISRNLVGDTTNAELVENGGLTSVNNDYQLTVSSAALSVEELGDDNLLIVFKDSHNNEEVFRVTDFESVAFQGTDIIVVAYLKSTQRPTK